MQAIRSWNNYLWSSLEDALTPLPSGSNDSKIIHILPATAFLPGALVTGCVASAASVASYAAGCLRSPKALDPNKNFSLICEDSRLWEKLGDIQNKVTLGQDDSNFLFGVATCTYQDSGQANCPDSQWAGWEEKRLAVDNQSKRSANLFTLYQTPEGRSQITDRLAKLGVNSYRFSIEWSHIQPNPETFDEAALGIYVEFCKHLRDQGIQPMVTLHHFSEPAWFHNLGSFEKEENISHFVSFATHVFTAITQKYNSKPLVEYVCTINEPSIEAVQRYVAGEFSPGNYIAFEKAGMFLKTILKAHTVAYEHLKAIAPEVQIGIVHQPFSIVTANPVLLPIARYANRLINDAALKFFKEGIFELKVPFLCNIVEKVDMPKTDFVGLQYYARPVLGFTGSTSYHEPMTCMPWREDPEGIYEAIIQTHDAFRAPVIITENGISTHSDEQRSRYMIRALYATQKAQEVIGKDNLKGYYLWSFSDNLEWSLGVDPQRFGAFALEKTEEGRVLSLNPKPGMDTFIKVVNAWRLKQNAV